MFRTDVSGKSATERDNPLYESQELTIEMFQETVVSSDEDEEQEPDGGEQQYESQVNQDFSDLVIMVASSMKLIEPATTRLNILHYYFFRKS